MPDSFWELTEGEITNDEKAVEIIRRCSSVGIFKQVMMKLGTIIEYARRLQSTNPLFVEGIFEIYHSREIFFNGIPSRIVRAEIKISNEFGGFILGSHFYMIVSYEGRIIGLRNEI